MDQEENTIQEKIDDQNEILLAALKLFAEKGYFNTSLTEIAQTAGLSGTSAIYHYFKNKQMIAGELYETIFDNLNVSVDDIRRKNQKPSEQLRCIVDLLFKLTDDAPHIIQFLFVLKINEFLPEVKPIIQTPAFIKILKIIRQGIADGELRSIDPIIMVTYFFGIINNTLCMVLSGTLEKKAEAYLSQTWMLAWSTIAKK
jgi:AcrR family transcriptional regulator